MKNLPHLLLGLSLAAASVLSAQTTTSGTDRESRHGRPGHPGRGGHPIVRAVDTDKDGELSAVELANAPASIRTLDTNGDGIVAGDEFRPARPAGAPEHPARTRPDGATNPDSVTRTHPVAPVMLALDANGDHALSVAEIANATASLTALDANKDGKLTRDELRPFPPAE